MAATPAEGGKITGHSYDRHYFDTALGPVPHGRSRREWTDFFAQIADRVVADIKPRRVLDVGCAKGLLVEALRDRGVEAYGIDISEYAIGEVRPDLKAYCRVASATAPLAERYDLIICVEVLEHLPEEEGRRAIENIAASTSDVLFSSTPDDRTEPTHVNVRPRGWWIDRFAEVGLMLDPECDTRFISAHALRFRGESAGIEAIDALLEYRQRLWAQISGLRADVATLITRRDRLSSDLSAVQRGATAVRHELAARRAEVTALHQEASARQAEIDDLRQGNMTKDELIAELERQLDALHDDLASLRHASDDKDTLIAGLNYHLLAVQRTIGWKILELLRRVRDRLIPEDTKRRRFYWRVRRPVEVLLDEGLRAFMWKTKYKVRLKMQGQDLVKAPPPVHASQDPDLRYQLWVERHRLTPADIERMKASVQESTYTPLISILTPVYDTDENSLRRAIESVRTQIYPFWELCLVNDGSCAPHVRTMLDEYASIDPRMRVQHLLSNLGIAGASNEALRIASGEFVALLDHDDELPPEALFEVVKRLNDEPDLDLVYTDEDKIDGHGVRVEPFFKPDWSPDLLLSMNYVTHFSVFRRRLVEEVGGFQRGVEGSQDYDLLLRFTERTRRIAHIPRILYHWRKSPGSAASSTAAKPFAYEAARTALGAAVKRRGYEATVTDLLPGIYAVRYRLTATPLVSIIIPTRDRWSLLRQCLRSIEERTRYPRYEIIVLDNDSTDPETIKGLQAVAERWRVLPCPGPFNFSAFNNFGATEARGEYLVFLNNDTQVLEPDWLGALLEHAQRPEVGAVGARLFYPDGTIQHAGIVLGVGGVGDHAFKNIPGNIYPYFALANVVRNVSAVTAACMMMSRRTFEEINGFDERLEVALNDVDLCLRLRQRGYLIVYTPFALLYHHESGTRGRLHPPKEEEYVWATWGDVIRRGDPYYNPNLTLSRTDWSLA